MGNVFLVFFLFSCFFDVDFERNKSIHTSSATIVLFILYAQRGSLHEQMTSGNVTMHVNVCV